MRALQLTSLPYGLEVRQVPVPQPGPGQVLVRVEASPCNPSDTSFLSGNYGVKRDLPTTPGFEGSGTVVATGGGIMAWTVSGKRVAFAHQHPRLEGCWAEYAVVPAMNCVSIDDSVSFGEAASSFVNPLTALAMLDIAQSGKHRAVIHTAAASALGKMLLALFRKQGIPVLCVVRRQEQADALRELGAEHAFVSTDDDFDASLKEAAGRLGATVAFDAVCGDMTGRVLTAMPSRGVVYVYGALSLQPAAGMGASEFIFSGKRIEGFWLSAYLRDRNLLSQLSLLRRVQSMLKTELKTTYARSVALEDVGEAIKEYNRNMSAGKVCICPFMQSGAADADSGAAGAPSAPEPAPGGGEAQAQQ